MFDENKPTVITLDHGHQKVTVELPWDAGMDDLIDAFYGMCVCATFTPGTIIQGFREFLEEKAESMKLQCYDDDEE